ncbi:MAG TPA: TonB family protein [Pyrinomonadaceae bacterium]|nr:TonB family protein [Pyrinomonadaceae bacterium]
MKTKLLLVTLLFCSGCSLLPGGPKSTVKKFMDSAQTGDISKMNELFSKRALSRDGIDKIRKNNESFSAMSQQANARGSYQMNNMRETQINDHARIGFHYQNAEKTDSIRMVFALTKEDGDWKIDNIGGHELEAVDDITSAAVKDPPPPKVEPVPIEGPLEGPPLPQTPPSAGAPISAGVLNGKAISLPKPPYPPAARAAKASGTVVVQVTLEEDGKVTNASAVSGHPLLRAAAVAAAYEAKFSPTRVGGKPVKVTGVINYNFVAE